MEMFIIFPLWDKIIIFVIVEMQEKCKTLHTL